jgi:hypothetical protein
MAGIGQAMAPGSPMTDRGRPIGHPAPAAPIGADRGASAPAPMAADDGDMPNVSPEEQAQYDQFVGNGRRLIYDDASANGIDADVLASLRATGDPVQDLAMTAASVVTGLIENASAAGRRIDPDIAYHGGVELLEDLADLAEAAGVHDFAEKDLEAAMYRAMDIVLKNDPGAMVDRDGAGQEFDALARDNRGGTLAQTMPALARAIDDTRRRTDGGRADGVEGRRR